MVNGSTNKGGKDYTMKERVASVNGAGKNWIATHK